MSFKKRALASFALSLAICTGPANSYAADDGIITKASRYSVKETVARFEAAVKQKEAAGFTWGENTGLLRPELRYEHSPSRLT